MTTTVIIPDQAHVLDNMTADSLSELFATVLRGIEDESVAPELFWQFVVTIPRDTFVVLYGIYVGAQSVTDEDFVPFSEWMGFWEAARSWYIQIASECGCVG